MTKMQEKLILECLNSRFINICPEDRSSLTKIEDFRYKCNKKSHRKIYSILKDTIFENKNIKFSEILLVIYLWCTKSKQDAIIKMIGHSDKTISTNMLFIEKRGYENGW
ncbi:hypothetical protein H311_00303 [Anncaliia algerae PRA109]|nr:hypothetical protein H311_00303 [Anncaliia algerae PRA109]